MPRTRKRDQDIQPLRNQSYGQRQETNRTTTVANEAGNRGVPTPGPSPASTATQRAMDAAARLPVPDQTLRSPSARPNEPVTAGLPTGPGAGPDGMPAIPERARRDQRRMEAQAMLPWLPALEQIASSPNASPSMKRFYRQLRSAVPPNAVQQLADRSRFVREDG